MQFDKICFFLDGEEDCVSFKDNKIFIFNIHFSKIKQTIDKHQNEVLDIAKLYYNSIISSSRDGKIFL